ncbi:MAG TPA: hypothetical protein EYQ60_11215 [Myxococcales bacterium]|nr:hypothetical protein [Myxococcales bacterium]
MRVRYAIVAAFLLGILYAPQATALWLRLPANTLERQLLKRTPLGANVSVVRNLITSEGWEVRYDDLNRGFLDQSVVPSVVVGQGSIRAYLGRYWGIPIPFWTDVAVFWGFDSNGKLMAIWVWKTVDGI